MNHSTFVNLLQDFNLEGLRSLFITQNKAAHPNATSYASECGHYSLKFDPKNQRAYVHTKVADYQFYNNRPDKLEPEYKLDSVHVSGHGSYFQHHCPSPLKWERLAFEEEDGTTIHQKLEQYRSSKIIPILWVLPYFLMDKYLTDVIHSENTPFGNIFYTKDGELIPRVWESRQPADKVYIKPEKAGTIMKEVERWKDMGGEFFFKESSF